MKFIWRYLKPWGMFILGVMVIKLAGTGTDLLIPYVLEHLLDHVVPAARSAWKIVAWGGVMLLLTLATRVLNITANRMSVKVAEKCTYAIRRDLFQTFDPQFIVQFEGDQTQVLSQPVHNGSKHGQPSSQF